MNSAMSDATPLSPHFLASLSQFLEGQHGGPGQGDISDAVKVAIAKQLKTNKPTQQQAADEPSTPAQPASTQAQSTNPDQSALS